jgi:hypothetical protein
MVMVDSRLDLLRRAVRLFSSERAIEVCKSPSGYDEILVYAWGSVCFL